ncbi:MAG: TolC family protein [Bacteroidota bacterium]
MQQLISCLFLLSALFAPWGLRAQEVADSILTYQDFMRRVQEHHPVALQADLQTRRGAAALQVARGAFDPKSYFDLSQKFFEGKDYYKHLEGGLAIPTWLGLTFYTGYQQTEGIFLNPEASTPEAGLWQAGASLTLGKGLLIDERRAAFRQAEIFQTLTRWDRQVMLNQLLYEAGAAYLAWVEAFYARKIYEESPRLAQERTAAVAEGARLGDRASIDTVEAAIQVQTRQVSLESALLAEQQAKVMMDLFLWQDGIVPLEALPYQQPEDWRAVLTTLPEQERSWLTDSLLIGHPMIQQYRLKQQSLSIEERWKKEQLKPQLDLKYNAINQPVNGNPVAAYSPDNFTWGVSFAFPLFLRKERGGLELTRVKIRETQLQQTQKMAELEVKATQAWLLYNTLDRQIGVFTQTVQDYQTLWQGERTRFSIGESSLFLVNTRESRYIQARIKAVEMAVKRQKAALSLEFALGRLGATSIP